MEVEITREDNFVHSGAGRMRDDGYRSRRCRRRERRAHARGAHAAHAHHWQQATPAMNFHRPSRDWERAHTRISHPNIHSLLSSILLSQDAPTSAAFAEEHVSLLTDVKETFSENGIPFGWELRQPMDLYGDGNAVTPLEFEILRAPRVVNGEGGWKESSALLQFLVEETGGKEDELEWIVRKACLRRQLDQLAHETRDDSRPVSKRSIAMEEETNSNGWIVSSQTLDSDANSLFQYLLSFIRLRRNSQSANREDVEIGGEAIQYEITISKEEDRISKVTDGTIGSSFEAIVAIPTFASSIRTLQQALDIDMRRPREKRRISENPARFVFVNPDDTSSLSAHPYSRASNTRDVYHTSEGEPSFTVPDEARSVEAFVPVQFLAARRAWRLDVASNALRLTLLDDGSGGDFAGMDGTKGSISSVKVDARVKVVGVENHAASQPPAFSVLSASVYDTGIPMSLSTLVPDPFSQDDSQAAEGLQVPMTPSTISSSSTSTPSSTSTSTITWSDSEDEGGKKSRKDEKRANRDVLMKERDDTIRDEFSRTNLSGSLGLSGVNSFADDSSIHHATNGADGNTFLLPRLTLAPLSQSGLHSTTLKPCFFPSFSVGRSKVENARGFDDRSMLIDGENELLLELSVSVEYPDVDGLHGRMNLGQLRENRRLGRTNVESRAERDVSLASPPTSASTVSSNPPALHQLVNDERESNAVRPTHEDDWEDLYLPHSHTQATEMRIAGSSSFNAHWENPPEGNLINFEDDETTYDRLQDPEIDPSGWVKASYSGRDEDV